MAKKTKREETQILGFIGVGLDNEDGHHRLTQNENFLLIGGSAETHEKMQDASIYFNEKLEQRGKPLHETEPQEAIDLLREALDR